VIKAKFLDFEKSWYPPAGQLPDPAFNEWNMPLMSERRKKKEIELG